MNFITTYSTAYPAIRKLVENNWLILQNDPVLKKIIPKKTAITFRKAPTIKSLVAPSRLRQHGEVPIKSSNKGSFKCNSIRCLCCKEITHGRKEFKSTMLQEIFQIKQHLMCTSKYIIYLLKCGVQNIGHTIQRLQQRMNKHRTNIRKGFMQHGVSRHIFLHHHDDSCPYTVTPIDQFLSLASNRFEKLKPKEMYWIFKLQTLQPKGLNEITEVIT